MQFLNLTPPPKLRRQLDAAYERVMSSGRYVGGAEVEAFEREWAEYCEVEHCVACGNGFDALQLILRAHGIGAGDEVLVPAWTATPTWAAVAAVGGKPVTRVGGYTKVQIAVPLYGEPGKDHYEWLPYVIEDAAQAHGLDNADRPITKAWSFYPTKNLGAYGDGGAITTGDDSLVEWLRIYQTYGVRGAINSRLDPLQAAFLRVKLPYLDGWNARRREHADRYLDGLKDVPGITLPVVPEWCEPVWHQFVIRTPDRDNLKTYLAEADIETMIHYPEPPHRALGYDYDLPEADRMAREVLSLPVGPHLRDEEIDTVIKAIKEWSEQ